MRTAKYHDFGVLRVAFLFIILVILGLFVYNQFIEPTFIHQHDAPENAWVTVPADCENDGSRFKYCTDCNEKFSFEVLPATGHHADDNVVVEVDADCVNAGVGHKICKDCGEIVERNVVISAKGHINGNIVVENSVEHDTSIQGASHDDVIYCTVCNEEVSREKVEVPHNITQSFQFTKQPTCIASGEGILTTFCNDCNKEVSASIEAVAPTYHPCDWKLTYYRNEYTLTGTCTTEGCDYVYDEKDGLFTVEYTVEEVRLHDCIDGTAYHTATIYSDGMEAGTVTIASLLKPIDHHAINMNGEIVDITEFKNIAEDGNEYYNVSVLGFYLAYYREDGQLVTDAENAFWNENGFGEGIFKCAHCGNWVLIRVYNDLA